MTEKEEKKPFPLLKVGIIGSLAYILFLFFLEMYGRFSWAEIQSLPHKFRYRDANEQGDFLAGFFAPLAFFWLVIGYFQNSRALQTQEKELKNSVDAVRLQAEEMRKSNEISANQTASIQSTEKLTKRDLFFRYADFMTATMDDLMIRILNLRDGTFNNLNLLEIKNIRFYEKAENIIASKIFDHNAHNERSSKRDKAMPVILNYIENYDRLINKAKEYEEEDFIEVFKYSVYTKFYEAMIIIRDEAKH